MAFKVIMPKWGLTMREGKITKWLKKEGEPVAKGDALFEVETEKVTNSVEAPADGILFQIVTPAGATVPVSTVVAIIGEPDERPERMEAFHVEEKTEVAMPGTERPAPGEAEKVEAEKFVIATPAARRKAKELGVDLALVSGTGPGGRIKEGDVVKFHEEKPSQPKATPLALEMARQAGLDLTTIDGTGEGGKITKEDVEKALEAGPEAMETRPPRSIPLQGIRKTIAENMCASLRNTAQLTIFMEVDVTEMVRLKHLVQEELKTDGRSSFSYTDIVILAASRALKRFPIMNSTLLGEEILLHADVHMGIAVAVENGLIVPVLPNADRKDLSQIARESAELVRKARAGTLTADEVTGGTFTITTLGMFGVDGFTPILRPPETGILGVGRVKEKPAVFEGEVAIRSMMHVSLTFDHRVVDGAPAGDFLHLVGKFLEHPALLLT